MANDSYPVLFRGFDAMVTPTTGGTFDVSLFEAGSHVFSTNVSLDLSQFENEDEIDQNSEALINEAAQAAVDLFEAQRGTLGQGAGVTAMKKQAWFSLDREHWFLQLKGTPFEAQAVSLLEQYVTLSHETSMEKSPEFEELCKQRAQLEYEIEMMNIKRMQSARANETVIVIRGGKTGCFGSTEEIIERFRGCPDEAVALKKLKQLNDVNKQINDYYESQDLWKKLDGLRSAMDELLITALQQEVTEGIVDQTGINLAPNMAADVAELMSGVTFETPIEPSSGVLAKKAQENWDEPERKREDVLDDALAMAKSMRKSPENEVKRTLMMVYDLSDKDAGDLVKWVRKGAQAKPEQKFEIGDVVTVWPDDPEISWVGRITYVVGYDDYKGSYQYKVNRLDENGEKLEGGENRKQIPEGSMVKTADKKEDEEGDDHPLDELGEVHEGKDVAEVPYDDFPFHIGDDVTLTKAYELNLWGGATDELPKGTKGKVKNLYDGAGNYFMIETEDGGVYRIPTEYLK